jgi:copper chaperone CopZ
MPTTIHVVAGMTSRDCANFVTTELAALPGVSHVDVDPRAGTASVTSDKPVDPALIHAAVTRAGFVLGEPERSRTGSWWPFARHFLEMVVAMVVGMVVLGVVVDLILSALGNPALFHRTDVSALVMATNMTIGMSLWMAYRKHTWAGIAEMGAAMYLPFVVLFVPFWAGLLSGGALMMAGHALMLPLMAVAMLRRRDEYTQHHRHAHGSGERLAPVNEAA